ncbi:CID4 [Symbiodinium sp. CCMP2592]|nr:CID4 [Symbiodinium sp. CCMP2592]
MALEFLARLQEKKWAPCQLVVEAKGALWEEGRGILAREFRGGEEEEDEEEDEKEDETESEEEEAEEKGEETAPEEEEQAEDDSADSVVTATEIEVQTEAADEPREECAHSFSHLEGGFLDEAFRSSTRNMPVASVILSTQPHHVATALQFRLLSTVPVLVPQVPQGLLAGAAVMVDVLLKCPIFSGFTGIIDTYETNRCNVLLPLMDNFGVSQIAKIRPENLKFFEVSGACESARTTSRWMLHGRGAARRNVFRDSAVAQQAMCPCFLCPSVGAFLAPRRCCVQGQGPIQKQTLQEIYNAVFRHGH